MNSPDFPRVSVAYNLRVSLRHHIEKAIENCDVKLTRDLIVNRRLGYNADMPPILQKFTQKIGGLFGIAQDTTTGSFELPRSVFMSGEEINIRIRSDFSKIKPISIKYTAMII